MLAIASKIEAQLASTSPIRALSDTDLARELTALKALQEILEPKKPQAAASSKSAAASSKDGAQGLKAPRAQGAPLGAKTRPLYKGSIFSKRIPAPAASRIPAARASSAAPVAISPAPGADNAGVPPALLARFKLRLQLCIAEQTARDRKKGSSQLPLRHKGRASDEPRKAWCAPGVGPALPSELGKALRRASPEAQGHWVRLAGQVRRGEPPDPPAEKAAA